MNYHNPGLKRAAIIPFTIVSKPRLDVESQEQRELQGLVESQGRMESHGLWFLMGIHTQTGEVTDFGGGVKRGEVFKTAAFREFSEETNDIFSEYLETITPEEIDKRSFTVEFRGMKTAFVYVEPEWIGMAPLLFKEYSLSHPQGSTDEISRLLWIRESNFLAMLSEKKDTLKYKMWDKLATFYSKTYTNSLSERMRSVRYERYIAPKPHNTLTVCSTSIPTSDQRSPYRSPYRSLEDQQSLRSLEPIEDYDVTITSSCKNNNVMYVNLRVRLVLNS